MLTYDRKILILGGTTEAYRLAEKLVSSSVNVTTSLAGSTKNPRLPSGQLRIGGFGGVTGLTKYIKKENIRLLIDATHPFSTQITANAVAAADQVGIALLRLERPPWQQRTGDQWIEVSTLQKAALSIPADVTVFLAIGRKYLNAFSHRYDVSFIARMLEQPEAVPPFRTLSLILGMPGNLTDEVHFFLKHRINYIVSRNSGGQKSYGKIIAARKLALPIIMIKRTPVTYASYIRTVANIADVLNFIKNHFRKPIL